MSMQAALYTKHEQVANYSPASTRATPTSFELDQLLTSLTPQQISYLRSLLSSDVNLTHLKYTLDDQSPPDASPIFDNAQNKNVENRLHLLLQKEDELCVPCQSREVLMSQLEAEVSRLKEKLRCECARFSAEREEWREAVEGGSEMVLKDELKQLRKTLGENKRMIASLKATHMAEIAALNRQRRWSSHTEETETETASSLKRENARLSKVAESAERLVADLRQTVKRLASRPGDETEECDLSAAYAKVVNEKIELEKLVQTMQHSMESVRHEHTEVTVHVESLKRQLDFSRTDQVQLTEQVDMLERERGQLRQSLLDAQAKTHTLQSETEGIKANMQSEVDNLVQSLNTHKQTVASLQVQLTDMSQAKALAEAEARRASEELTRLRCGSDGELVRLREAAEEAESNLRKLEANVSGVTSDLEAAERRAATLSVEVDRLRSTSAAFETEAAQLKRKLVHSVEESRQELRGARVELAKLRGSKEDSDRIIANLHADIRRLNANKEETERTLTTLQGEIAPLKVARDEALQKVVDLEVHVTRLLEAQSTDPEKDVETLQQRLAEAKQEVESLQDQLEKRNEEIDLLTIDKDLAIQELQQEHKQLLEDEKAKLQQQCQTVQAQLQEAREAARKIVPISYESETTEKVEASEVAEVMEKNAQLTEKVQELEEGLINVSMLEEHIASLEGDLRESVGREGKLRSDVQSLESKLSEAERDLKSLRSRESVLMEELEVSRLETTMARDEVAEEMQVLLRDKSERQSEIVALKEEIEKLEAISQAHDKLQQDFKALELVVEESAKREETLAVELGEARKAVTVAESALNASLESCEETPLCLSGASESDQLRRLKVALKQKISTLNDERARALMLAERLKEKEQIVEDVRKQMRAVEDAWKSEYETYEAHLHKTCAQLSQATTDNERLMSDLAKQSKEVNALKSLIERSNEEIDNVQSFKKEQKTLTKTIQVLEAKCDQLRKRIHELEAAPQKKGDSFSRPQKLPLRSSSQLLMVASVAVLFSVVGYLSGSATI